MNRLLQGVMAFIPIAWMVLIYYVNSVTMLSEINIAIASMLFFLPLILTAATVRCMKIFDKERIDSAKEIVLADHEFLPVYLGYFFVAVSITNMHTMILVFGIIYMFIYLSQHQYFNPVLLIAGYHFYHVKTKNETRVFIICKGHVIKNCSYIEKRYVYRINNTTFLAMEDSDV